MDYDDYNESRMIMEKKLPAFGYIFLFIISGILIAILFFSMRTPKIDMIITRGTVTSQNANYVMSGYTGQIAECYMKEGAVVEEGDILFYVTSDEFDLQKEQLLQNRAIYEEQIEQYQLLIRSIKDDTNYFSASEDEDGLYYNMYEAYKAQVAQNELNTDLYQSYGYSEEQIEIEIIKNQGVISELYYTALNSAETAMQDAEEQLVVIDAQISAIESGESEYVVKATASGVLHIIGEYNTGMMVQQNATVATITPEKSETVIEAYVSTADMARIHEGDYVQIAVDGLSQAVYGTVDGTICEIDSDLSITEESDGSSVQVFKIEIVPEVEYLVSREGKKIDIINGMTVEARIQYDEMSYYYYFLDKLGIKAK